MHYDTHSQIEIKKLFREYMIPPARVTKRQVIDTIKCFYNLWVKACMNNLYESGMPNIKPNLLYIESRNYDVAVR